MKVDGGAVVLQFVLEVNDNSVTPVGFNEGTGHLTVDHKANALDAVWCNSSV